MNRDRLAEFYESIKQAPSDPVQEFGVRRMVEECAATMPLGCVIAMAKALADYRKEEIKTESELN